VKSKKTKKNKYKDEYTHDDPFWETSKTDIIIEIALQILGVTVRIIKGILKGLLH